MTKKQLAALGLGSKDYVVNANSNVVIVRWLDNGLVQLASSCEEMVFKRNKES